MCSSIGTNITVGKDHSAVLSIRVLLFFAVCLPTITVYLCIISSFLTHADVISNYSLSECPHVKSTLPPVSYSIGSWEPQKQLWMFVLILHSPARVLIMMMLPRTWREFLWRLSFYTAVSLEMLGLVCVTIFYVDSIAGFYVHAASFGVWWAATIWLMSIVVHVQRVTGAIRNDVFIHRAWLAKIAILTSFVLVSCATSIAYVLSQYLCSLSAFTIFILGEYTLIAVNASFWIVVLVEFSRDIDGFRVNLIQRAPKIHPHFIVCNDNQFF